MDTLRERAEIEFVILANHVEAVNGLLYISGGGWAEHNRLVGPNGPPVSHFGVGVAIRIPWNETNIPHRLSLRVENEDATLVIAQWDAGITVGRPPTLEQGAIQHAVLGISIDTVFPRAGGYRVVVQLDEDGGQKTWPFRVRDLPAPGQASGPLMS
jgi:hypothetical protein